MPKVHIPRSEEDADTREMLMFIIDMRLSLQGTSINGNYQNTFVIHS